MAFRRNYQRGGVTGRGSTLSGIKANQERERLSSIQALWNQYQQNKWLETQEAASMENLYAAGGSKIGGGLGQLLGNYLWGGKDPNYAANLDFSFPGSGEYKHGITSGVATSDQLFDAETGFDKWLTETLQGLGGSGYNMNPILQAGLPLLSAWGGSKLGRGKVDVPPPPTFEGFEAETGFKLGDSKYHPGLRSGLKMGAAGTEESYERRRKGQKKGDNLTDILGAFSDMAFFGEMGDPNWLQNILNIFEPTAWTDPEWEEEDSYTGDIA